MNLVDTSGWLAFFTDSPNAAYFAVPIQQTDRLIVPSICIYEISKIILRESDEHHLIQALAALQKGKIVHLDPTIAIAAAKISLQYKIPMADSIIYATARAFDAILWTQDIDFKGLPDVKFIPAK